jgi:hypothetical protein
MLLLCDNSGTPGIRSNESLNAGMSRLWCQYQASGRGGWFRTVDLRTVETYFVGVSALKLYSPTRSLTVLRSRWSSALHVLLVEGPWWCLVGTMRTGLSIVA